MGRFARVVAVDIPHHITQRGNARRQVFESGGDRLTYLGLLREHCQLHDLSLLGYCLMSNHLHLVAIPRKLDSMALALRHTHGRYAAYLNARQQATGHVWQGRYYSCPLDTSHLWAALRYTECNPVRAGLVTTSETYAWSSAAAHCQGEDNRDLLELDPWKAYWTPLAWLEFISAAHTADRQQEDAEALRRNTHTGRPLGTSDFVRDLERRLSRPLVPRPGGRPRRQGADQAQRAFSF